MVFAGDVVPVTEAQRERNNTNLDKTGKNKETKPRKLYSGSNNAIGSY